MTYHNKLILKRILKVLAIIVAVILIALVIGFNYLGRYVVYTEDGAYFSFNAGLHADRGEDQAEAVAPPEAPVLVIGDPIYEDPALGEESIVLEDHEVHGLLVDYDTLLDGSTLNSIELSDDGVNTLMLEMRKNGSEILTNAEVMNLINRAQGQEIKLVALISCLDDSDYALENVDLALQIAGALWLSPERSYYLNPDFEEIQQYIISMISTLIEMGFDEVILENFEFPEAASIVYPSDRSREEMLQAAYQNIEDTFGERLTLGLLITDPENGHQAYDEADHLYVCFSNGRSLQTYRNNRPDKYIVFVTDSHDTRFDDFGKLQSTVDYSTVTQTDEE